MQIGDAVKTHWWAGGIRYGIVYSIKEYRVQILTLEGLQWYDSHELEVIGSGGKRA